ncbi:MAG: hypothetical protein GYA56_14415 [Geobacteraceae bacterium]|nr:hypothetical protein [Geobacteraceae bacterium]
MSKTFDRFLKQYNSTGREKGDGYDASHFKGLTSEELDKAEEMLINDAMLLDTTAIQGLGELKTANSEIALRLLLSKVKAPSKIHISVVSALWEITHDINLQRNILENYDCKDEELKRQAAIVLEYTTPSLTTFKTFVEILRTASEESILRIIASSGILYYYKLINSPSDLVNIQKHMSLIRLLSDSFDEDSLFAALAEVQKEAAKLKG